MEEDVNGRERRDGGTCGSKGHSTERQPLKCPLLLSPVHLIFSRKTWVSLQLLFPFWGINDLSHTKERNVWMLSSPLMFSLPYSAIQWNGSKFLPLILVTDAWERWNGRLLRHWKVEITQEEEMFLTRGGVSIGNGTVRIFIVTVIVIVLDPLRGNWPIGGLIHGRDDRWKSVEKCVKDRETRRRREMK